MSLEYIYGHGYSMIVIINTGQQQKNAGDAVLIQLPTLLIPDILRLCLQLLPSI